MFRLLYDKFTQDIMYQILSQSVGFCRLDIKNILVFFRFTVYNVLFQTVFFSRNVLCNSCLLSLSSCDTHSTVFAVPKKPVRVFESTTI